MVDENDLSHLPAYLRGDNPNKDRAKRSNKTERRVAGAMGGKRIARSGAKSWSRSDYKTTDRGDISTPTFHVEHKRTDRESLGVKREWLEKVSQGAKRVEKVPALAITFEQPGQPPYDWVMLPLAVVQKLFKIEVDDG